MKNKLVIIILTALVLRLLLIFVAYHGDLNNNISWGNSLLKYGAAGYYEQKVWQFSAPNQPPLYILLFGLTSWLNQSITNLTWYLNNNIGIFPSSFVWFWQTNGMTILVKLPSIFADLAIGLLIYKFFQAKKQKELGLKLAALWLFNPLTFYNSSIWGQTDPIVNLLGLVSIYYLLKKDLIKSVLFFVISLLFKGSLTIFLPVLLLIWILQKHHLKIWLKTILLSGIFTIFVSVWFHPNLDLPIWLFNLYVKRFFPGEIGYLTANAFNLWYLVNPGKVLDNIRYFGLQAHTIGYLISLFFGVSLIFVKRKTILQEKTIIFLLAISALISFLFFTRIHERYLYPFFPLATILVGLNKKLLIPYAVLSATFLLNMYNLFWAPGIPSLQMALTNTSLPGILSIINLISFAVIFLWVGYN